MTNQPKPKQGEEIWLQIGENQEDEDRTWAEDKINESDIKYIRADVVEKTRSSAIRETVEDFRKEVELIHEKTYYKYCGDECIGRIVKEDILPYLDELLKENER